MARRVLKFPRWAWSLPVLALTSCQREQHAPPPSPSASAAGSEFTARAREQHFREELTRANARWQEKPSLGDCAVALKDTPDLELCKAAESALAAISAAPPQSADSALEPLARGALALVRLAERLRYLSLQELAQRSIDKDAGAPRPALSGPVASALSAAGHARKERHAAHGEQRSLQLSEGPIAQHLALAIRLERDVLRNLGAFLEYGPLPVRRATFELLKGLRAQHPRWPALDRLVREAAVLESDETLKQDLQQLSPSSPAPGREPAQSADTK